MSEATVATRRQPLWLAVLGSLTLLFMCLPVLIVVPMSFSPRPVAALVCGVLRQ